MTGEVLAPLPALEARLEALPRRQAAAGRVDSLKSYLVIATAAVNLDLEVRRMQESTIFVFPDAPVETSRKALAVVRKLSASLQDSLKAVEKVQNPAVEVSLRELKKAVQTAANAARNEWKLQSQKTIERHALLVAALHSAGIQGSDRLLAAVERVRLRVDPPMSPAEALRASEDITAVANGVRDLRIEGPVKEFLTAAAEKRGDARRLQDPAVIAFLEEHNLWEILVVAFR